ncbi:unnamed protein product [Moneuplotes crassus]|uniref:Uncharacterized protein n=1 Tax=Euplotes crassus TaxID=5936 RepID=A0AAD1Y266_EUPCR|nr:unnamed protein product [Moneuplotes crassus]
MNRSNQTHENRSKNDLGTPPRKFFTVTEVRRYKYNPYMMKHAGNDPPNRWSTFKKILKSMGSLCKKYCIPDDPAMRIHSPSKPTSNPHLTTLSLQPSRPKLQNVDIQTLKTQLNTPFPTHPPSSLKPSKPTTPAPLPAHPSQSSPTTKPPLLRKRRYHQIEQLSYAELQLKRDLQQPVVPRGQWAAKRRKREERKEGEKREERGEEGDEESLGEERRKKGKEKFRKELERVVRGSIGSDVYGESVKRIVGEVIREERAQSKKETIELLREQGILPPVCRGRLSVKDIGDNPFLEDEGFVLSDVSGKSTPQKNASPSKISRKNSKSRKNSFKVARTSSSKERKFSNTSKRTENREILQRQIIMPTHPKGVSLININKIIKNSKLNNREEEKEPPKKKRNDLENIDKAQNSSILSLKSTKREISSNPLLTKESKSNGNHKRIQQESNTKSQYETTENGKNLQRKSLTDKKISNDKNHKKKKKSRSRSKNSLIRGHLKNSTRKEIQRTIKKKGGKKPIPETTEEDDSKDECQEVNLKTQEKMLPKPIVTKSIITELVNPEPVNPELINPKPANPEPVNSDPVNSEPVNPEPVNPEPVNPGPVNPEPVNLEPVNSESANPEQAPLQEASLVSIAPSKSNITEEKQEINSQEKKNPFVASATTTSLAASSSTPAPSLLFKKTSEPKPAEQNQGVKPRSSGSLFGNGTGSVFPNSEKKLAQKSNPFLSNSNVREAPVNFFSGSNSKPEPPHQKFFGMDPAEPLIQTSIEQQVFIPPPGSIHASKKSTSNTPMSDDVGMGESTPPTQSPTRPQQNNTSLFSFNVQQKPSPGRLFGPQGSNRCINSQSSLFGNMSTQNQSSGNPLFSMGQAKPSNAIFGVQSSSNTNMGQTMSQNVSSWNRSPFANPPPPKKNMKKDDGLFSDRRR